MINFSIEYLRGIVERFNKIENLGEQWEFIKEAIETEQVKTVEIWIGGVLDSDTAKARLYAFRWLLDFIGTTSRNFPSAKERLELAKSKVK